jgi:hypothetical protein
LDAVVVPPVCVPAVEPVPDIEPDWLVPLPVSFDAEPRVLLLLLLQPKTSAAASAIP